MKLKKIFGLAIALLALAVSGFAQATTGTPKLTIKETEHNFGEVKKTANPTYTFIFKNEGKVDLEIKRVAPT
ncbi:MAG: DUF1573 domain-containing protein [Acidobacteriota bacterium]|nr:DUF1573 domain-containing protein [Acidobacteriota bacterium]